MAQQIFTGKHLECLISLARINLVGAVRESGKVGRGEVPNQPVTKAACKSDTRSSSTWSDAGRPDGKRMQTYDIC